MDSSSPNICVVVGELSADVHAAQIISELKKNFSKKNAQFSFWGIAGPHLRNIDVEAYLKAEDLAVMGFLEVLKEYLTISKAYHNLVSEIRRRKPSCVILFDYPGFNLKLAQDLFEMGLTVIYCIPPKVWAHGAKRIETLRDCTHLVLSILPFEEKLLRSNGVNAHFIGNFLRDEAEKFKVTEQLNHDFFKIGILPGSRRTEIANHLPVLLKSFEALKNKVPKKCRAYFPVPESYKMTWFKQFVSDKIRELNLNINIEDEMFFSRSVMKTIADADYTWVASGTAALEVGLLGVPMSVHYIMNPLTFWIAKKKVKLKYVNLVNICMEKEVVPEFLQEQCNVVNLVNHACEVLENKEKNMEMKKDLNRLRSLFPLGAPQKAADFIEEMLLKETVLSTSQKFYSKRILKDE